MITDYPIILDGAQPYDLSSAILHALRSSFLPLAIGEATGPARKKGEDIARRAYSREWMRAKRERAR